MHYHLTLGGEGLVIDLATYRKRVARQFADKLADGDLDTGDLLVEQVWRTADWSGGEGYLRVDPARTERFRSGAGGDGFSEAGSLRLGPGLVSSFASTLAGFTVLAVFRDKLYAGTTDGKVYEFTASTWTLTRDLAKAGGIRAMAVHRNELFVGNGTDGIVASFDGTTWTNARFTVASSTGVRALAVYYDKNATNHSLYVLASRSAQFEAYDFSTTLSVKHHDGREPRGEALVVQDATLYGFGGDASSDTGTIYRYDRALAKWDILLPVPEGRPTVAVVFKNRIYVGIGKGLWVFDGKGLELVRANLTEGSELGGLAVWRGALWVSAYSASSGLRVHRYDGASWQEVAGGGAVTAAAGLAVHGSELYQGGAQAGAAPIVKYGAPTGVAGQAAGTYRATATVESAIFSAGLPGIDKVFRSVVLRHGALLASESVELQYRLEDTGSWTSLGTSSTVGSTGSSFSFAAGVVGRLIALRAVLAGPGTSTPVLYEVTVSYQLSPTLKREWEFAALLEGTSELPLVTLDNEAEPRTGAELSAALWALKAGTGPLTLIDLDGVSRTVWFVELEEKAAERSQRLGYSTRGLCRLVEA